MLHEKQPGDTTLSAVPSWVRDAVFYQIFPDRFARSSAVRKPTHLESWDSPPTTYGFKGGDLRGIAERLDYLSDIGVNALYLTPIFSSAANHRYHTFDYMNVDPLLGGNEALRFLLDNAHARRMRVVLDGVFNHASRGFFQFNHVLENGSASPYRDWFHFNEKWLSEGRQIAAYPESKLKPGKQPIRGMETFGYDCWWNLPALPKFNTSNPEVREYIFQVAEHWLRFGIDGWRLDVPNEIDDDDFWREFRIRVRKINPEAYIVGEIWENADRWLQGDQFDAVMNYELGGALLRWSMVRKPDASIIGSSHYANLQPIADEEFETRLNKVLGSFSTDITLSQMNMLGSHDTPRIASILSEDVSALRLATALQFSMPGTPCIYYGDELAMRGGHDPDCRRSFPTDPSPRAIDALGNEIHALYRDLAKLRHQEVALRQGTMKITRCSGGLLAFERTTEKASLLVVANRENVPQSLALGSNAQLVYGSARLDSGMLEIPARDFGILRI